MPRATPSGRSVRATLTYTHGGALDQPLDLMRSTGEVVILHADWRGQFDSGSEPDGTQFGCQPIVSSGCKEISWAGGNLTTFLRPGNPNEPLEWYGSLISGQRDQGGLVYMRNRYYDSSTGQFTQSDPIGIAGGLNTYGYAGGDPVNFSDPFGLCPRCDQWAEEGSHEFRHDTRRAAVNGIGAQTGSTLGADFVEHFFYGEGAQYTLSAGEFAETAEALAGTGVDNSAGTRNVSFYGTSLARAYGTATGTFDADGNLTGIADTYDFDRQPPGARSFGAELVTRAMSLVGRVLRGDEFPIAGSNR